MPIFAVSAVINALTASLTGLFVLFRNPKSVVHRSFFLFALTITLWSLSYWQWQISENEIQAIYWCRILAFNSIFIPVSCFYWVLAVSGRLYKKYKLLLCALFLSVIISLFSWTDLIISGVRGALEFPWWPIPGAIYIVYMFLLYGLVCMYVLYVVLDAYRNAIGLKKLQLRYVLIGMLLAYVGGLTNFPLWFGLPILPVGNFFVSLYFVAFTYTIIKYRFMDIRLALRTFLVHAITFLIMGSLSFGLYFILWTITTPRTLSYSFLITSAVLIINLIGHRRVLHYVRLLTDRIFFQREFSREELLRNLGQVIAGSIDRNVLFKSINTAILHVLQNKFITSITFDNDGKTSFELFNYSVHADKESDYQKIAHIFGEHKTVVKDEALKRPEHKEDTLIRNIVSVMDSLHAQVIVPIKSGNQTLGLFILGEKRSGDGYTTSDIHMLEALGYQTGTALENSRLYEELKHFSQSLENEVRKATADLRATNEKLLRAYDRLKELESLQSDFIPIAANELNAPLMALKNYAWMLKEGSGKRKNNTHINKTISQINSLVETIEKLRVAMDK